MTKYTLPPALAAILIVLALAASALAAKPAGTSTIALNQAAPSYGDTVNFTVTTTETAYPFVNLNCSQNGALVAVGWAGYFTGALGTGSFGLYSPVWTGGAATCTADLKTIVRIGSSGPVWRTLASTTFQVT